MKSSVFLSALAFMVGILLGAPGTSPTGLTLAALLSLTGLVLILRREIPKGQALCLFVLVALGALSPQIPLPWHSAPPPRSQRLPTEKVTLIGTVDEPIGRGRNRSWVYLRLERALVGGQDLPLKGRARIGVYEAGAPLRYGDRVKVHQVRLHRPKGYGNPGAFDMEGYMWTRGIVALGAVGRWDRVERLGSGDPPFVLSELYQLRERLLRAMDEGLPPPYASLLNGLLFGERQAIPREVQDAFYRSGTGHLLAISGLHVGFVAFFFFRLLKLLARGLPRRLWSRVPGPLTPDGLAASLTIPLVLAYMVMARYPVSTVRATVMITIYLVARALQRDRDLFGALGTAALVIFLWQPVYLFDVGFQLSFLCVLCIIAVNRYLKPLNRFWDFVRVTVLVSLAVLPLIALYFHRVTVYGVLANLVMVPLASLLIPVGLVASALSVIAQWAGVPFFAFTHGLAWGLVAVGQWISSLPHAAPSIPPPSPLTVLAFYALALALFLFRRRGVPSRVLLLLAVAVLAGSLFLPRPGTRGQLRVVFLDVGDADSTFIRFPDGRTMLVDAGGTPGGFFNVGEAVVAPFLRSQGIRRLDYLVLTHSHQDHAGGLSAILRAFEVGEFWESGLPSNLDAHREALALVRERGIRHQRVRRGFSLAGATYRVEVLYPPKDPPSGSPLRSLAPPNDSSLVLRILHGGVRVLLPADLERSGERDLLRSGDPLEAQVLKLPHHGSWTSSSWGLVRRVRPEVAVLSAARPWIGHPSVSVLSRYHEAGAQLFRTDEDGAVELLSDGEGFRVRSHLRREREFQGFLPIRGRAAVAPRDLLPLASPVSR